MSINLKLLNAFLLIAEHGSFRRAAELSGRSQSALSLQVWELEGQLGASLFHRTTRTVSLTREGNALLPHARRAIAEMEAGLRQVRSAASMQGGRLALGCPPHIAGAVLPALLMAFHAAHPGVALRIREMPQAEVLEGIRRQELDFGIGPRPANAPSLIFTPLIEEEILALAPPRLASQATGTITLTALGGMPAIITSGTNSMRAMVEEAAASNGVSLQIRCEVQMPETAIALAATGLGLAVVPQFALAGRRLNGLRVLRITDPPLVREVGIVQLRGNRLSPSASTFQTLLQAAFAALPSPAAGEPLPFDLGDCAMTSPSRSARSVAQPRSKRPRGGVGKRVSTTD
jgi:DNA-binding transcriptional LysR family regulator